MASFLLALLIVGTAGALYIRLNDAPREDRVGPVATTLGRPAFRAPLSERGITEAVIGTAIGGTAGPFLGWIAATAFYAAQDIPNHMGGFAAGLGAALVALAIGGAVTVLGVFFGCFIALRMFGHSRAAMTATLVAVLGGIPALLLLAGELIPLALIPPIAFAVIGRLILAR